MMIFGSIWDPTLHFHEPLGGSEAGKLHLYEAFRCPKPPEGKINERGAMARGGVGKALWGPWGGEQKGWGDRGVLMSHRLDAPRRGWRIRKAGIRSSESSERSPRLPEVFQDANRRSLR